MTVLEIQRRLSALGFKPGPLDGIRGKQTTAAIRAFQARFGLVVDGIVGPQTRTALKRASEAPVPARPEPDKSAMGQPAPALTDGLDRAAPPPNTVTLLDTAREIDELIWHCAATPEGKDFTVADIRAWHKQRGFSDIGYHFVVYRDGRILLGRPIGQQGAHCADEGKNRRTIGCCYIGGVTADSKTAKDTRTPQQRSSMLWLTEQLGRKFKLKTVSGHNQYAAKACPSFDVRKDALGRVI